MAEDPYEGLAPLLELTTNWLARPEAANLPLELATHDLRRRGDWRLSIYRTGHEIEGVGVVMPGGHWFLEAHGASAATYLANAAAIHGRRPATLSTTERVGALIRPMLAEKNAIAREHTLRTLRCVTPPVDRQGRWATSADLPALRQYETQIDRDQRAFMDVSWEGLVARQELAVLANGPTIVATVRRYGPAPDFAGIADLFVLQDARRNHIGTQLAGFVVGEILARRKAVYVLVDASDAATLDLYGALGFEDLGACYRADLK